jgi:hypothetical protein
VIGNA